MNVPRITPEAAEELHRSGANVVFVDTRGEKAWRESERMIPGARRIPAGEIERHADEFGPHDVVVAYCT